MKFIRILTFSLCITAVLCFGCKKVEIAPTADTGASSIKFYGDNYGNYLSSFQATADGGYIFGGYTLNSDGFQQQGFMQKTDSKGIVLWYKLYGGIKQDLFWMVRPTSDGGYIAAGATTSLGFNSKFNSQKGYLLKADVDGNVEWQKSYGGAKGALFYDVTETPDHGFVAAGSADGEFYVVKTNEQGDSLWTRALFKGYPRSFAASVAVGPGGNIAIAGFEQNKDTFEGYPTFSYLTPDGTFLIRNSVYNDFGLIYKGYGGALYNSYINNNSSVLPPKINLSNPLCCEKIISRSDGFIFVLNQQGLKSILLYKVDFNGKMLWNHIYFGKVGEVFFGDATNSPEGGLLISGGTFKFDPSDPFFYCWLLNTDAGGTKTMESFIPMNQNCWAVGAVASENSISLGANLTTPSNLHANYFGFISTDLNGKVK